MQVEKLLHLAVRLACPNQVLAGKLTDRLGGPTHTTLRLGRKAQFEELTCLFGVQREKLVQVVAVRC